MSARAALSALPQCVSGVGCQHVVGTRPAAQGGILGTEGGRENLDGASRPPGSGGWSRNMRRFCPRKKKKKKEKKKCVPYGLRMEVSNNCPPRSPRVRSSTDRMTCAEQQPFSLQCHKAIGMRGFSFRLLVCVHIVRVAL